jgi:hypothetical protein
MNFLPTNYSLPKADTSHYFRLEDGNNTFRVLSPALVGWKYWTDKEGRVLEKPVKGCTTVFVPSPDQVADKPRPSLTHFWAFVVWNYQEEQVQILEITQNTIMEAISQYLYSAQWGDPSTYDFIVHKRGSGLDTSYQVTVNPKEALDPGIVELYQQMQIDLTALFRGDDPFKGAEKAQPVQ